MNRIFLLICGVLTLSQAAEAAPRHHYPPRRVIVVSSPRPSVVVHVNPWISLWAPDARPGWHWVAGQYAPNGQWVPGYWAPDAQRPGWMWVPGHWSGASYVDGYWREEGRSGYVWVDGYYDAQNNWVPGYWAPYQPPPPAPPPPPAVEVHHSYP